MIYNTHRALKLVRYSIRYIKHTCNVTNIVDNLYIYLITYDPCANERDMHEANTRSVPVISVKHKYKLNYYADIFC